MSTKKPIFYVVTRSGRRAWPRDYWTIEEAQAHADSLSTSLRRFKDPNYSKIVIIETTEPEKIN
jgi:hypothetical protein